jgi:hypothetical protein
VNVQNYESLRFYPNCRLTSHPTSFLDAGARIDIPGSEIKEFLTHISTGSMNFMFTQAPTGSFREGPQ